MSANSSNSSNGGVILDPPLTTKRKQISPAKRWCFTFNNYTESDYSSIVPILRQECDKWIVGKEIGESGTPHLQGFFVFKTKKRPSSVFNFTKSIHFERTKGNDEQNIQYCSKDGDFEGYGIPKPPKTIKKEDLYDWQKELVDLFKIPCEWNCRNIYWRWGGVNIGKTQFCKYLCVHHDAVIIGGSYKHILAQVQNQQAPIYIVLLSYGDDKVSYRALEQIKDGLFSSAFGCDNNKMEIRDAPHLLVIGNEPPDEDDRHFHPTKYHVSCLDE
ncbi:MAG: putative viral replication protein [Cressdnaviricota sp.]|nr:MAG: putative viral replication protein [Cressdnaviricota sp.]